MIQKLIQIGDTQYIDPQAVVVVQWNSRSQSPQVILSTGQAYNATDYRPAEIPPDLEISLEVKQECLKSLVSDIQRALHRIAVMPL